MERAREYKENPGKGSSTQRQEKASNKDREPVNQSRDDNQYNDGEEGNIDDFIEILAQHQKECEVNGKYVEAEMAKNRIAELKANKKSKQLDEILIR